MFRLSPFTKRTTASLLLLVFLHLMVKQCLCLALGMPMGMPLSPAKAVAATATVPDAHACCKKAGRLQKEQTRKPAAPAGKPDDCCKYKSVVVLKTMDAPTTKQVEAPAVLSLPPVHSFTFARFVAWDATAAVVLVPPQHLPPKIPDIRVFLRSLTV